MNVVSVVQGLRSGTTPNVGQYLMRFCERFAVEVRGAPQPIEVDPMDGSFTSN